MRESALAGAAIAERRVDRQRSRHLHVVHLGLVPYARALELQRAVARARISGAIAARRAAARSSIHPSSRSGAASKAQNLVASPALLAARGVELFEAERGGDVTFHGPGQLVGYPIVNLRGHKQDLHWYLRQVEAVLDARARDVSAFAARAQRRDAPASWTGGRKIASIGVHARDWVTWHGFALNVSTDLSYFDLIVPCGLSGVTMTSIDRELGDAAPPLSAVAEAVAASFGTVFAVAPESLDPADLSGDAPTP